MLTAIAIIAPIITGTMTSIVPYFRIKADADIIKIDTTIAIIMTNLFRRLTRIVNTHQLNRTWIRIYRET